MQANGKMGLEWKRGAYNGADTGQHEYALGERGSRPGGALRDRVMETQGRAGGERSGSCPSDREETGRGGGRGSRGRGRGRGANPARGGGRGTGSNGREETERGRTEGLGGGGNRGSHGGRGNAGRGGATQRGRGRGRGGNGFDGAQRGTDGEPSAAEGEGSWRGRMADRGARRGGHSVDRRGGGGEGRGGGDNRRDGPGKRQERNGGGRSHSTNGRGGGGGHGLGYRTLEELSGKEPSVVAITLSSHRAIHELLSGTDMRKDLVEVLCSSLSVAFKARADRSTVQHLARMVKDSGFFRAVLPYYLAGMETESNPDRRAQYPQHLEHILAILSEVLSIFPASSIQAVNLLLTQLQASINSLKMSAVDIKPTIEESVENLKGLIKHLLERSREGTLRSDKDTYGLLHTGAENPGEEEPQQDFRTIPIYPTREEFHEEQRPFLRPNLTAQRYASNHLYLDTHFRLLREDFVRPLREGIQKLLYDQRTSAKPLKTMHFDDIRVYFDTKLMVPKCTHTGLAYVVQFDSKPLKFVRWENTKRLIFGSLVCLSCDNFDSFLFATVSDRDPKDLNKGLVQITFTEESRHKMARFQNNESFLMIETTAYFEAYRYVLEGLQEQEEDNLPFQRYIVECNKDVQPPDYLLRSDTYNLSSVTLPRCKKRMLPFHSLQEAAWPKMEDLGLDESQMRAFKMALTKELAIIQGPPGTGKTYVGLKIAQALLTNQGLRKERLGKAPPPILVVCYTNHALDQFLEGIHKFLSDGIVRVGGRSNSETLKRFNLRELSRSHEYRSALPSHLRWAYSEIYKDLHEEEENIQEETVKLECALKGVLRETFLVECISSRHYCSLINVDGKVLQRHDGFETWTRRSPSPSHMMEWLGLDSTVFLQRETEYANGNEEEGMEEEEEELIQIDEEADLIQADRIIEDDIGPRGDRRGKEKAALQQAVREAEEMMLAMNLDNADIQAGQSEQGWEMQKEQKKKMKRKIKMELRNSSAMTEAEEKAVLNIWTLSLPDRWKLYRLWVSRYRVQLYTKVQMSEEAYQNAADRLADVKRQENICLLKRATVIGMTTTGAAKFRKILQEVAPSLVIVEEAAEVLEAHTITTLSQACQHLILIGDHQQLRPSATVYELAKNFHLEMSMFERLVNMGIPFVRLNYQHRMSPDIARLLTPHIYSELENHPSVLSYDNIKGLNTNLFFLEHKHHEETIKDGKSHQNKHEAMFVVALCRYLLRQEYKPEHITILTTYTGQLYCLRNLMPAKEFTGVKVHVVDKYQGEENDIVLLSLVRSNPQFKVGFLSIPNRVCVALSRARKGLYCIGNSEILGRVKLWSNIFSTLREKNQVGKALTLCCQNHPDRQVKASCAEDFLQAPEGGCTQPCEFRLECGHVCTSVCHPYDPEHIETRCGKKCQKFLCDLEHKCPLLCYMTCPEKCPVTVEKTIPQCQHLQMVPCHQDPKTFACREPCQKLLHCGHPCDSLCGGPCTSKCKVKVTLTLGCGHSQQDACFYRTQLEEPECRTPCEHQLKCDHVCSGTCGKCSQGRFHAKCFHQCDRLLICSHKCKEPCTRNCPPCKRPCENCCIHSQCMKQCGQPCAPCIEPCAWQCPHQSCSKLCHEACDRPPCTQPCAKNLDCGHPCIGLCGDKCPSKCRICNHDEVTEIFFGTEEDPEAHFIQLQDCGHIIEYTAMDTYMQMDSNQQGNEGEPEKVAIKLKECPRCRTPIRKNLRYGSHINSRLAEIEMVKSKIHGHQLDIEEKRKALQEQWEDNGLANERYSERWENNGLDYEIQLQAEYMFITHRLKRPNLTARDLWVLENKMDFLGRVSKLRKSQIENMSPTQGSRFGKYVEEFVHWLRNRHQTFTEQQVFDLQRELQRLTLLAELNARCHMADKTGQSAKIQSEVHKIRDVLEKSSQFTEQDGCSMKEAMKELDKKLPVTGLGISEEDRKMIVSAFDMLPGHWYKCPNGHVYVITECGGAMESRPCPECNATIGGGSHRLASGNQVASEMDGAQQPAWPQGNNDLGDLGQFF